MGNVQPKSSKLVESEAVAGLSFLEDGIVLRKKGKTLQVNYFFRRLCQDLQGRADARSPEGLNQGAKGARPNQEGQE